MKVKIGSDDFCLHCMEWREYDNEGRCKVCKHKIHSETKKQEKEGYSEYNRESSSYEFDDDIE